MHLLRRALLLASLAQGLFALGQADSTTRAAHWGLATDASIRFPVTPRDAVGVGARLMVERSEAAIGAGFTTQISHGRWVHTYTLELDRLYPAGYGVSLGATLGGGILKGSSDAPSIQDGALVHGGLVVEAWAQRRFGLLAQLDIQRSWYRWVHEYPTEEGWSDDLVVAVKLGVQYRPFQPRRHLNPSLPVPDTTSSKRPIGVVISLVGLGNSVSRKWDGPDSDVSAAFIAEGRGCSGVFVVGARVRDRHWNEHELALGYDKWSDTEEEGPSETGDKHHHGTTMIARYSFLWSFIAPSEGGRMKFSPMLGASLYYQDRTYERSNWYFNEFHHKFTQNFSVHSSLLFLQLAPTLAFRARSATFFIDGHANLVGYAGGSSKDEMTDEVYPSSSTSTVVQTSFGEDLSTSFLQRHLLIFNDLGVGLTWYFKH